MSSIFKQNFAIHVKNIFVIKWSFFSNNGLQVNMSYLLKGLFFDVRGDRGKILFTTENLAMNILTDRFCLFSSSSESIKETCHFFFFLSLSFNKKLQFSSKVSF